MLHKALVLFILMTSFFFVKELSNNKVFDNKAICLNEDLNENAEDDTNTDTEEDINWSACNQTLFKFYLATTPLSLFSSDANKKQKHPIFEIQSPPPQEL